MTVDPRLRKQKRAKGSGGALMLNIRVRHIKRKSDDETPKRTVRDALQHLLDRGVMPEGWQFMFVDWKNPDKYGTSWQSGWPENKTTDDPDEFNQAFSRVVQTQIRMARVRPVK
jgi:hypothetical protein